MVAAPDTRPRASLPKPADARVLVAGLVCNAGGKVAADVQRLGRALAAFKQVQWLLIESDSSDDTLAELARLHSEISGFDYTSLGTLSSSLPLRTQRIAHCRNAYLERLDSSPELAAIELVLMADFDGINDRVDETAILSCWARDDWDVCAANPAGPYYDIWALRHPLWSPNDYKSGYRFLVEHGIAAEAALQATVLSRMVTIDPRVPWIEVDSAFGGLAIYRRSALLGLRYAGLSADGQEVCEHVAVHEQIRTAGGRIFINPRLVCAGPNEHTRVLGFSKKIERAVRRAGKRVLFAERPGPGASELPVRGEQ
ncbi:MAG: hypothetical protein IPK42_25470 [Betaproteobacteria bacterium]|nr:hypothetical protein [Betaproteobacteria bacterium]